MEEEEIDLEKKKKIEFKAIFEMTSHLVMSRK